MMAVLLISHGSRYVQTEKEVAHLVQQLKEQSDISIIEYAFLEIAKPSIQEGIDICIEKGAKEIIILLNFLNSGKHVDEDIPNIINDAKIKYPDINIRMTKPIGRHDQLIELFLDMVNKNDH